MKTLKIIFFASLLFSLLILTGYAQQTTLKWNYSKSKVTFSRTETFDWQYGRYDRPAPLPYKLAIIKNDVYLTGAAALRELRLPVWGDGTQVFEDLLPDLTPAVPRTILIAAYSWFPFPDTVPSTEAINDYEARTANGKIYQMLDLATLPVWELLSVVEWRPFNTHTYPIFTVDNPMFPIIEAQRLQEREVYAQILSETFVQMGTYSFPSFKVVAGCQWFLKMEGETEFTQIPMDAKYWLASSTGGWKPIVLPLKLSDQRDWQIYVSNTILSTGEARLRLLLNM